MCFCCIVFQALRLREMLQSATHAGVFDSQSLNSSDARQGVQEKDPKMSAEVLF